MYYKCIQMKEKRRGSDFKELSQVFMETAKSRVCRVGPQPGNQGRVTVWTLKAAPLSYVRG